MTSETRRRRRLVEQVVLAALADHGELSRAEIQRVTGIPRATVIATVATLVAEGRLVEGSPVKGERGRPANRIRLPCESGAIVVADSSQGVVRLALVSTDGVVIASAERRYDWLDPGRGWVRTCGCLDEVPALLEMYDDLRPALPAETPIRAGVVGVWGPFVPGRGWDDGCAAAKSPSPGPPPIALPRHDPARALEQGLGISVRSERGPVLRATGEVAAGAAQSGRAVLYLQVAEVLASAIVVEGRPFTGADGMAGELTHIVAGNSGQPCFCGRRGCLGATVGVGYLIDTLRPVHGSFGIDDVLRLAADGERSVRRAFEMVGRQLGSALTNALALMGVDLVVVDADLGPAGVIVGDAFAEMIALGYPPASPRVPEVRVGALPQTGYAVGGAALLRQQSRV